LINLGEAGLGQPLPFTAKDKSLNVEPSLTRRYDIYWIDLAFSPSEELLGNATELRYDIAMLDDDTIALDLLPMRFGREVGEKDGMSVPSIKVGSVEVGEMFSRTVEYKRLLPTVLSHGLQTQTFGWTFTGDSLDASAKRMFAVIGVPKGTKQVKTRITLEAKCREYAGFASEWASTAPHPTRSLSRSSATIVSFLIVAEFNLNAIAPPPRQRKMERSRVTAFARCSATARMRPRPRVSSCVTSQ
jgi:hypothetical protein